MNKLTKPEGLALVLVGTSPIKRDVYRIVEYLTPDYVIEEHRAFWSEQGYDDLHVALRICTFQRLTDDEANSLRTAMEGSR